MKYNFEKDVLDWCIETIIRLGYRPISPNDTTYLLGQVFTITNNLIPPIPRTVKVAKSFSCPREHELGYSQVISEIENGVDLSPRGSRQQRNKEVHTDEMLIDWGIHHLHLGTKEITSGKKAGLIEGHKKILFVFFTSECAHIIGIYDHASWVKTDVLTTVKDNWEHLLEPYRLNRVIGLSHEITENDRGQYRKNCVNFPIQIGNAFYFGPGGGFTLGGLGYNEIEKANIVLRATHNLTKWVTDNTEDLAHKISPHFSDLENEVMKFEVSKFILTRTFTIQAVKSSLLIHIPCNDEPASLVHSSIASVIEPEEGKYNYWAPSELRSLLVEKITSNIGETYA